MEIKFGGRVLFNKKLKRDLEDSINIIIKRTEQLIELGAFIYLCGKKTYLRDVDRSEYVIRKDGKIVYVDKFGMAFDVFELKI